jgi:gamma-glutamyl hercynylcysteine S-oxide synthase
LPSEEREIKPLISFTAAMPLKIQEDLPVAERDRFDLYTKAIPSGLFTLAETGKEEEIEEDFEMGIYPVTNSQYQRFYDAGGYDDDAYWTPDGAGWRKKEKITVPRFWLDEKWNQPDYPVVGVSWHEAQAYCNWLSAREKRNYRLPTETQWEKAASWDEAKQSARIYPWGGAFDKEKCNTRESEVGSTTSVERYPQGRSPYGCHDMAGNVLEWTESLFSEKEPYLVLRGGSWDGDPHFARCASPFGGYPNDRVASVGFRCSRTKK